MVAALLLGGVLVLALVTAGILTAAHRFTTAGANPAPGAIVSRPAHDGAGLPGDDPATAVRRREAIAAAPMPVVPASAAQPQPIRTARFDPIALPAATGVDALGVGTGFAHTPAGALAQLAAIDQAAFATAAVRRPQEVITGWSSPGGPDASSWSGVRAMSALLTSLGATGDASSWAQVRLTPLMGLIKGVDGPDFAVVCVNAEVALTNRAGSSGNARVGVADCQRMIWDGTRWRIGPGAEPAPAPSTWPGSQAAYDVGYRDLTHG